MFNKIRSVRLDDYKGTGTLYRHDKTGMEVFHLATDSTELACCFMFATPSRDDMGVAHIIEHTVLCGSGHYPVKDPFSQILMSSPNTFLNAMTYTDKTVYPFASPLKKDFDILFDIYSDAVFNPLLRKQSFEQEGVRYYGNSFDGVVYNEMTGALSSADDIAQSLCMRDLYSGTPFMYESGGNPLYIADLTYDEYLKRYRSWYSPSNCRLFLFGNLDPDEYMGKIEKFYLNDENLKKFTGEKYTTDIKSYGIGNNFNLEVTGYCPQKDSSSVILTWLTEPSDDPLQLLTLTVLVDILLGDPGAPLYKAICESDLGDDLNPLSGTDPDFPLMPFIAGFTGAKNNKEHEIKNLIMQTLEKIVECGLDEEQVEAAIRRQEFRLQEISGGSVPYGITAALRSARTWLRNAEPEDSLKTSAVLEQLKKKVQAGRYFENWIQDNLINNPRCCLLTIKSSEDYNEKLKKALDAKLQARIEKEEPGYFREQKEIFEKFIESKDSPEDLATIPRIQVSDLPTEIPSYSYETQKYDCGTLLSYPLFTNGIVYLNMAFSTLMLSEEDRKLLLLLLRVMQMSGTDRYDYVKLGTLLKKYTGSFSLSSLSASTTDFSHCSDVMLRTKMLVSDVESALDLILNVITKSDVTDVERIKASLTDIITEYEMNYTYSANVYANLNACAGFSKTSAETETVSGTSAWLYYKKLKEETRDFRETALKLDSLKKRIFSAGSIRCLVGCDEENLNKCTCYVRNMLKSIPVYEKSGNVQTFNCIKKAENTMFVLSSGPAYNAMAFPVNDLSQKELTQAMLFSGIVSGSFLWDLIRGQNGAYGVYGSTELQERFFSFVSYRDPSIDLTYDAFEKAFDCNISKEELEYNVVTIIGKELRPLTPQQKCNDAFRRYLYNMTDSLYLERRKTILETTLEDVRAIAGKLKEKSAGAFRTSICGSGCKTKMHMEKTLLPI